MSKAQERAWREAEKLANQERLALLESTRREVFSLLQTAKNQVAATLASQPSDYQHWRLTELNAEIDRLLGEIGNNAGTVLSNAAGRAWEGGQAALDNAFKAASIDVSLTVLDTRQLMAMRTFMVDRIKNVTVEAAAKIKSELGLALIGGQNINETIANVAAHLGDSATGRAKTIVGTELSRVWATASYERAVEADSNGVEMDKIWRRSGKIHSRLAHDLADGKRIKLSESFTINGHKLRYPHDPKAPASETVNCGCIVLYRPRGLSGTLSDKRPFTAQELALNPYKEQIARGKSLSELLGGDK